MAFHRNPRKQSHLHKGVLSVELPRLAVAFDFEGGGATLAADRRSEQEERLGAGPTRAAWPEGPALGDGEGEGDDLVGAWERDPLQRNRQECWDGTTTGDGDGGAVWLGGDNFSLQEFDGRILCAHDGSATQDA